MTTTPPTPRPEPPTGHGQHEPNDGRFHPFGRTLAEDLAMLQAGNETLWWDETGAPAPWPQDFLNPAAGWTDGNNTLETDQQKPPITADAPAPF